MANMHGGARAGAGRKKLGKTKKKVRLILYVTPSVHTRAVAAGTRAIAEMIERRYSSG